jgi:hypothetical protein
LQGAAVAKQGSGCTTEQEQRRLGHLRIFDRRDGIRHTRARCYCGDPREPGQSGYSISGKYCRGFVPDIPNAYSGSSRFHVYWSDMATTKCEQVLNSSVFKYFCDELAAIHMQNFS